MKWEKTGFKIAGGKDNVEKTIYYETTDHRFRIESYKRPIPHANGSGSWLYTDYTLYMPDGSRKTFNRLSDAKDYAASYDECEDDLPFC